MTKVRAPLLSINARGSLGNSLTFSQLKGATIAKRIPLHPDTRSSLQLYRRQLYQQALIWWRTLTPLEQEALRSEATLHKLPIYQYFMGVVLSTVLDHHTRHENGGADEISVEGLSGELADPQPLAVHGADKHTDVTRDLFIPVQGYTNGAGFASYDDYCAHQFDDNLALKHSTFSFKVPSDFVSFTSLKAVWVSSVGSGNMYWTLYASYGAVGEAIPHHADHPAFGTTATGGAAIINVQDSPTALTMSDLALGDFIGIKFWRQSNHADDTLNSISYLLGVLLTYTAEQ